jgi:hypothetical protein
MNKSKPMFLVLLAVFAFALTGCGKSNNNAAGVPPVVAGQYGGYPTAGGALGSACTSIQGPIPFQGSMYIDSANVLAGQGAPVANTGYPNPQNPYGQGQITMSGSGSDGWMTIQAQMISATSANGAGQLQLSQLVVQQIMYQMQFSGMPYNQVPCAQIVSINIGHYNTTLYGGVVRIMINGTIPYNVMF